MSSTESTESRESSETETDTSTETSSGSETETSSGSETETSSGSETAESSESGSSTDLSTESTVLSSDAAETAEVSFSRTESTTEYFPRGEEVEKQLRLVKSTGSIEKLRVSLSLFESNPRMTVDSLRNSRHSYRESESELQLEPPVEVVEESLRLDDAETKAEDQGVEEWMKNEKMSHIAEFGMGERRVLELTVKENPMKDPLAVSVAQTPGFKDARIVKLLSEDVRVLDFSEKQEEARPYAPSRELRYLDEVEDGEQVGGGDMGYSVVGSYLMGYDPQSGQPVMKVTPAPDRSAKNYVTIKVTGFGLKGKPIEPVVVSACLYAERAFISEEWNFAPDFTIDMFQHAGVNMLRNHDVAIEIPQTDKQVALVFVLSHILTVDANAPINKYYLNSKHEGPAKKNLEVTWPRNKEVFTTFGWACLDLNEILNSEKLEVNGFYTIDKPVIAVNMKRKVADALKWKRTGKLPFQIKMDIGKRSAICEQELTNDGLKVVRLTHEKPKLMAPVFSFGHRMQLRVLDAHLKVPKNIKARNIFGEISLRVGQDGAPLKAVYPRNSNSIADVAVTRCWYHHEDEALFDELFVFDMPYPVDPNLCIVVEFFHAIAKLPGKSNAMKSYIGCASLPLFESGRTIDSSVRCAEIQYKKKGGGPLPKNNVQLQVSFDSAILTSDPNLAEFFASGGSNASALRSSDPREILTHFFGVVDAITNTLGAKTREAIECLSACSALLEPILQDRLNNYLTFFGETYAVVPENTVLHKSIMDAWANYMENENEKHDDNFMGYLLAIMSKSLVLTKNREFSASYANWLLLFTKRLASMQTGKTAVHFDEFARLTNILFDLGYYRYTVQSIGSFVRACLIAGTPFLDQFLVAVLRPKVLYTSLVNFSLMKDTVLRLIRHGVCVTSRSTIFHVLLVIFGKMPQETQTDLVNSCLYQAIAIMSPLRALRFVRSSLFHAALLLYAFLIGNVRESTDFANWWNGTAKEAIFKSIHFLLEQAVVTKKSTGPDRVKEMTYAIHCSILSFLRVVMSDMSVVQDVTSVVYHMLWVNMYVDAFSYVIDLLCDLIELDIDYVLKFATPALPKFVIRLFKHSKKSECISKFFVTLFSTDKKKFNSTERSMALCCRALSLMSQEDLKAIHVKSKDPILKPLEAVINKLVFVNSVLEKPNITLECQLSVKMERVWALKPSPDAVVQELMALANFHRDNGYFEEEIQTQMLAMTFIIEHLSVQKRIKLYWGELHAANCFARVCANADLAIYPHDECPEMGGFCDSEFFSFRSLMAILLSLQKNSVKNKRSYEEVISFIDILWPIYEDNAYWLELVRFFKFQMVIMRDLAAIPETTDRLFGQYFRVAFYGRVFGEQDGCTFVYHEKGLTHLYEFSTTLIEANQKMFGTTIELIKESGKVDRSKLNESQGYIQITSIKPYFSKEELRTRTTSYEMNHNIKAFYFDTPFTKNSSKAQGGIDEQWIKRTILTCDICMPSVSKVELIRSQNIVEREFSPIRVSYRMLHERVSMIEQATVSNDYQKLQQLLHGSLLAQVNEGPARIAEVFLSGSRSQDKKYTAKMKRVFAQFLDACKKGLAVHAQWVNENPAFRMLQDTLESSYASLECIIGRYL